MKANTFRIITFIAALVIISTIGGQFVFLKKAFDFQQKVSSQNIQVALKRVYREITGNFQEQDALGERQAVKKLSSNYFVVNIDLKVNPENLKMLLKKEFSRMGISGDFQFSIYDKVERKLIFGDYVSANHSDRKATAIQDLPVYNYQNYYFCVYFPFRIYNVLAEMGTWILLSMILLITIIFFTYAIYIILKQKRLSEIQKDFINNMTHEFQTPISTISISSEALRNLKLIESKERIINYATIIQEEALRLQKQVDTVLQVARIDEYQIKLNKEIIDAHQYILDAVEKVKIYTGTKPKVFDLKLQAEKFYIEADPIHFFNIVYNLLDNAVKYSRDIAEVTVATSNYQGQFEFSISDKGVGMDPKEVRRIFQKFYRIPSKGVNNIKGFGIGLYYVRIITKAHGGKIHVQSAPEAGTTFSVCFPKSQMNYE